MTLLSRREYNTIWQIADVIDMLKPSMLKNGLESTLDNNLDTIVRYSIRFDKYYEDYLAEYLTNWGDMRFLDLQDLAHILSGRTLIGVDAWDSYNRLIVEDNNIVSYYDYRGRVLTEHMLPAVIKRAYILKDGSLHLYGELNKILVKIPNQKNCSVYAYTGPASRSPYKKERKYD